VTAGIAGDAARARRLYLTVVRKVDGLLQGEHLGAQSGPGTELAETRVYQPGDDVRRLDWAVLARTGDAHVRTTRAERELETTLVVDLSSSMSFGTRGRGKRDLALTVAAAFSHLGSGPGDRLSAVVLSKDGLVRVPPRPARSAGPRLLQLLDQVVVGEGAAPPLGTALRAVPTNRRGLVVVVSDLLSAGAPGIEPEWQRPLRLLAGRHDVVVVEVLDPSELTLPQVGLLRVVDPESGRFLEVPTGSGAVRRRYAEAAAARRSGHAAAVRAAGADHLLLSTDGDWLKELSALLAVRRRVRAARRAGGR
jgi:uncharacterized protein (DUF58 family)